MGAFISYLSGGDDLKGSEGSLEVGGVGLKVVEGTSDAGLKLRRVLARGAVRRDLVQCGTHDCGFVVGTKVESRRRVGDKDGGLRLSRLKSQKFTS